MSLSIAELEERFWNQQFSGTIKFPLYMQYEYVHV